MRPFARRTPDRCKFCRAPEVPDDLACIPMCDACCCEGVDGFLADARTLLGRWRVLRRVRRRRRSS